MPGDAPSGQASRRYGSGLRELGATVLQEVKEPQTGHVVMADPEGNEFRVR